MFSTINTRIMRRSVLRKGLFSQMLLRRWTVGCRIQQGVSELRLLVLRFHLYNKSRRYIKGGVINNFEQFCSLIVNVYKLQHLPSFPKVRAFGI